MKCLLSFLDINQTFRRGYHTLYRKGENIFDLTAGTKNSTLTDP